MKNSQPQQGQIDPTLKKPQANKSRKGQQVNRMQQIKPQVFQLNPSQLTYAQKRYQKYKNKDPSWTKQRILQEYPGLTQISPFQLNPQEARGWNNVDFRTSMARVKQFSDSHHLSPQQVFEQLKDPHTEAWKLYCELKRYISTMGANMKIRQAIAGKVIQKTAQDLKIPLKDAMIVLILDDYQQTVSQQQPHLWNYLPDFKRDYHQQIQKLLDQHVRSHHPQVTHLQVYQDMPQSGMRQISEDQNLIKADQVWTSTSDQVCQISTLSQDPYAVDTDYIRYLFGNGKASPAPRYQNHYMYMMTQRMEVPVTTLPDGTACICIVPTSAHLGAYAANANYLPFVQVASTNSVQPYNAPSAYTTAGPFNTQQANIIEYGVDAVFIDFINTQSQLNCKGRLQTSFYYEPPNATWIRSNATGLYNTNAISITDTQLTNNIGYTCRKSNAQCRKLTRLGTWILQENKNETIPGLQQTSIGSQVYNRLDHIIIKFNGVSPSSVIGTCFITVSYSVQPIAQMRGILPVTPRGSYQGTFRLFKQLRKSGVLLQFLDSSKAQHICVSSFKQLSGSMLRSITYGYGQTVKYPTGFIIVDKMQNIDDGMCASQALKILGFDHEEKSYMTLNEIISSGAPILRLTRWQFIFYNTYQTARNYIYLDDQSRHASVITYDNLMQFMKYCVQHVLSCYYFDGTRYNDLNPIRYYTQSHHRAKQLGNKFIQTKLDKQQTPSNHLSVTQFMHQQVPVVIKTDIQSQSTPYQPDVQSMVQAVVSQSFEQAKNQVFLDTFHDPQLDIDKAKHMVLRRANDDICKRMIKQWDESIQTAHTSIEFTQDVKIVSKVCLQLYALMKVQPINTLVNQDFRQQFIIMIDIMLKAQKPLDRSIILSLLQRGGIEINPGPEILPQDEEQPL